jgi:lipoyl synthase
MELLYKKLPEAGISDTLQAKLTASREISWANFGRKITFYLPGMFEREGLRGNYPAVSVTGDKCELQCAHCKGKLLKSMTGVGSPEELIAFAKSAKKRGAKGILLSGGSTHEGYVPLGEFLVAVPELKKIGLIVSAHCGFADEELAEKLARYNVDTVLTDIVCDDFATKNILNIEDGTTRTRRTMSCLQKYGLNVFPHIILGLGDRAIEAIDLLAEYKIGRMCYVVLMPQVALKNIRQSIGTEEFAEILCYGRKVLPTTQQSLGCARPKGISGRTIELIALLAGINKMALWSDETEAIAHELLLSVSFVDTCCSTDLP